MKRKIKNGGGFLGVIFTSRQKIYFIRLLKRYGQKQLNDEPTIIIDTIHSVKGGEADHVVLASKNDYASDFYRKK
jgi:hypothetical protein